MSNSHPELDIEVSITRLPLTSPCPVRVNADGEAFGADGEFLSDEERDQFCAVDAGWMIGSQRVCDVHLRWAFEHGGIEGSFDELLEDVCSEHGVVYLEAARVRAYRPWSERFRYTQDEAAEWAKLAREKGLA